MEYRCLGRVEIFRCAVVQHSSAKANGAASLIANRKHDAVAKAIVLFLVFGLGDDHTRLIEKFDFVGVAARSLEQIIPARRGIANPKLGSYFAA